MDIINIGKVIAANRKEKGVTQEDLANYLGVSKPAVSKWESGQSYPDILLLPVIAAYFNISVDQLIGYEPQMTKEDIRKLYQRLAEEFAKNPFDQVYEECEEYIKKYFSCWYLQYKLALLYVNHCMLAGSPEKMNDILARAISIFERVEKCSEEVSLAKEALQLKALCYITLQKPEEAIDILEGLCEPQIQPELLLIKAYQQKGEKEKAIAYLQGTAFANLCNLFGAATDFFAMYADQPDKMDSFYRIYMSLSDLFEMEQLHPAALYTLYLNAAAVFVMQGRNEKAIEVLEKYVILIKKSNQGKISLHGSKLFDSLETYMSYVDIETEAPRSSEVIWRDLKTVITQNPAFAALEKEPRFEQLKRKLEE